MRPSVFTPVWTVARCSSAYGRRHILITVILTADNGSISPPQPTSCTSNVGDAVKIAARPGAANSSPSNRSPYQFAYSPPRCGTARRARPGRGLVVAVDVEGGQHVGGVPGLARAEAAQVDRELPVGEAVHVAVRPG
jgi:hypothetical protein